MLQENEQNLSESSTKELSNLIYNQLKHAVFVYGTLRPKYTNYMYFGDEVRYVGSGTIQGTLLDLGGVPGVIKVGKVETLVKGDILEISEKILNYFDRYEGEGALYKRIMTDAVSTNGEKVKVWVYEFMDFGGGWPIIKNGEWDGAQPIHISQK